MASDVNPIRATGGPAPPRTGPDGAGDIQDQRRGNGRGGGRRREAAEEEPPVEPSEELPEAQLDTDSFAGQRASSMLDQLFAEQLPWEAGTGPIPGKQGGSSEGILRNVQVPDLPESQKNTIRPVLGDHRSRRVEARFDAAEAVNQTWAAQAELRARQAEQAREAVQGDAAPELEETPISRILKQGPPAGRARGTAPLPPLPPPLAPSGDSLAGGPIEHPQPEEGPGEQPPTEAADGASAPQTPQRPPIRPTAPPRVPQPPPGRVPTAPLPRRGFLPPAQPPAAPKPPTVRPLAAAEAPRRQPAEATAPPPVAEGPRRPPTEAQPPRPVLEPTAAPSLATTPDRAACLYRVVDLQTDAPLALARVEVEPVRDEMLPTFNGETDAEGWFRQQGVPPGEYRVTVRFRGYVPVYRVRVLEGGVVDDLALFIAKA